MKEAQREWQVMVPTRTPNVSSHLIRRERDGEWELTVCGRVVDPTWDEVITFTDGEFPLRMKERPGPKDLFLMRYSCRACEERIDKLSVKVKRARLEEQLAARRAGSEQALNAARADGVPMRYADCALEYKAGLHDGRRVARGEIAMKWNPITKGPMCGVRRAAWKAGYDAGKGETR